LRSKAVPEGGFAEVNGTANVPSMEKPEEFKRVVLGFLRGVDA
jgi:hypothetical protein